MYASLNSLRTLTIHFFKCLVIVFDLFFFFLLLPARTYAEKYELVPKHRNIIFSINVDYSNSLIYSGWSATAAWRSRRNTRDTRQHSQTCTTLLEFFVTAYSKWTIQLEPIRRWSPEEVAGGGKSNIESIFPKTSVRSWEIFPRRIWTPHYPAPSHWCVLRSLIQNQRHFTATNCVHRLNANCVDPHPWKRTGKIPQTPPSSQSTHRSVVRCFWHFSWKTPSAAVTNTIHPPKVFVAPCCALTCPTLRRALKPIKDKGQWQAYFLSNKRRDCPRSRSIALGIAVIVSGRVLDGQPTRTEEGDWLLLRDAVGPIARKRNRFGCRQDPGRRNATA